MRVSALCVAFFTVLPVETLVSSFISYYKIKRKIVSFEWIWNISEIEMILFNIKYKNCITLR